MKQKKTDFKRNIFSFFQGFLHDPSNVASILPSSRFLEKRLVNISSVSKARLVVELGPGIGGTTMAFLDALPENSVLLAIELNLEFTKRLKSISDPRLIVHYGNAVQIRKVLTLYGLGKPDLIVSGIPFSTMPLELGEKILSEIWKCLAPGGSFVAYQFRDRIASLGEKIIGKPSIDIELLNVPPVHIYSWRKD